jgi:hypothetical protein
VYFVKSIVTQRIDVSSENDDSETSVYGWRAVLIGMAWLSFVSFVFVMLWVGIG